MNPPMQSFACGACGFALYALAVLVVLRLPGKSPPVLRQVGLALLIHVGTTTVCLAESLPYWYGAALYGCCFIFALFGHSAVYKSVSLAVLGELARAGRDGLPLKAISEGHVRPLFVDRISLLIAAGYVAESDGCFRLTEAGRRLGARMGAVQKLFGVTRSGLYGSPVPIDRAAERH